MRGEGHRPRDRFWKKRNCTGEKKPFKVGALGWYKGRPKRNGPFPDTRRRENDRARGRQEGEIDGRDEYQRNPHYIIQ